MAGGRKSGQMDMTDGPVLGNLLRFTIPLVFSGILQLLFNAADIVVVGRFAGDKCLAAVSSNGSLINLCTSLFIGLSVGANVVTARALGAKDTGRVSDVVHTSVLISIISGLVLTVIGVIGAPQFLLWMGTPEDIIALASEYLRLYFLGMTATMVYNFGAAILRAVGETKKPLYFLIISGAINLGLNLVFVIVFGMDVDGVALATVISQAVSASLVISCLMRHTGAIRFEPRKMRIKSYVLSDIVRNGLPAGIQGAMNSFSNVTVAAAINVFGSTVVAGSSLCSNIDGFLNAGVNAFFQAAVSFTAQNAGAKKYSRIWRVVWIANACALIVGTVMGVGAWYFGEEIAGIYTKSPEIIAQCVLKMTYLSIPYALVGLMNVFNGALRGMGYSVLSMTNSLLGMCAFRVFWVKVIHPLPAFSAVTGIYIAYPISWAVTLVANALCLAWVMNRAKKKSAVSEI